jgi:hypothetical protein
MDWISTILFIHWWRWNDGQRNHFNDIMVWLSSCWRCSHGWLKIALF